MSWAFVATTYTALVLSLSTQRLHSAWPMPSGCFMIRVPGPHSQKGSLFWLLICTWFTGLPCWDISVVVVSIEPLHNAGGNVCHTVYCILWFRHLHTVQLLFGNSFWGPGLILQQNNKGKFPRGLSGYIRRPSIIYTCVNAGLVSSPLLSCPGTLFLRTWRWTEKYLKKGTDDTLTLMSTYLYHSRCL